MGDVNLNLNKLFETQKVLDARIEKEHPKVKGEDRIAKKILALQVELGELANEWRGFKFWSNNQEPRNRGELIKRGLNIYDNGKRVQIYPPVYSNPLLEEYVDCLHFILSIGLELGLEGRENSLIREINIEENDLTILFQEVLSHISDLFWSHYHGDDYETEETAFKFILSNFVLLGQLFGFTWGQIEQAYYQKNEVNHERQNTGY